MSRVTSLYELQQIDSALQGRILRLHTIEESMADAPELIAARAAATQAANQLAALHTKLKQATSVVEDASGRIRAQDKRLYDGSIKNSKELGQVQEEVGHLKERLRGLEEQTIELMLEVETTEDLVREKQEKLEEIEKAAEQYRTGLLEEKDKLIAQAKVLQVKRQRLAAEVSFTDLQVYERLRRAKAGVGVATVRNGLCDACHVGVSANVIRSARSGTELVQCPQCGRILYPLGSIEFKSFDHDLDNVDK